jgi:hypothetical protein
MVRMATHPRRLLAAVLLALPACNTADYTADFATNENLYVDVPFTTALPGDRPVCVTPTNDGRVATPLPANERGFPITYTNDEFWERPVAAMVGDVLRRQVEHSDLFVELAEQPTAQAIVLKPTLVTFLGGSAESISGRRAFADVALRLQAYGPQGPDGSRALLLDQTFTSKQASPTDLNPPSPYKLLCRGLQQVLARTLNTLDGSNIARSNVPANPVAAPPTSVAGVPAAPAR